MSRFKIRGPLVAALAATLLLSTFAVAGSAQEQGDWADLNLFFAAASPDRGTSNDALEQLEQQWKPAYGPMLLEFVRFLRRGAGADAGQLSEGGGLVDPEFAGGGARDGIDRSRFSNRRDPRVQARERLVGFLEERTGQDFGDDLDAWRDYFWSLDMEMHPGYGPLKANLYANIDPKFRNFFNGPSVVRMDEVDWGGVLVSGIPALDHPPHIPASDADYLADSDIVYGISIEGEHRAYPRRIMAWHEMAWDDLGGKNLTIVYCTLCGTLIPYDSEVGGREVKFDTSGLLYRSNKLMYEDISWTLWSSITGEPVIGPMVGSDVKLTPYAAVTTTWGEWRREHPDTTVLSRDTGFERDYSEGAAYRDYFATDELMFGVPEVDPRLPNKAEVLAMRFDTADGVAPLAIAADFLADNRVFQTRVAGRQIVVVTSPEGANRVYASGGYTFVSMDDEGKVVDSEGGTWDPQEDLLVPDSDPTGGLTRLPAWRAFWFGWFGQYPDTELIGA